MGAQSAAAAAKNLLSRAYYWTGAKAGLVCAKIDNLAEFLERGKQLADGAVFAASIGRASPDMAKDLQSAAEELGKMGKQVGDLKSKCTDIAALNDISQAIAVLNAWSASDIGASSGEVGPKEAAAAFDMLFTGAARFAQKMPPPANFCASVLKALGDGHFFAKMQAVMDPSNPNLPGGRVMRDAFKDAYSGTR